MKRCFEFLAAILSAAIAFSAFCCPAASAASNAGSINISEQSDYDAYLSLHQDKYYSGEDLVFTPENFLAGKPDAVKDYNGRKAVMLDSSSGVNINLSTTADAVYEISVDYCAISDTEESIEGRVEINGVIPYDSADNIVFPRIWVDEGAAKQDKNGNDLTPAQIQREEWQSIKLSDSEGLYLEPLKFYMPAGNSNLKLLLYSGKIAVSGLKLRKVTVTYSYEDVIENYGSAAVYNGKDIVIEGENAVIKSSKELRPISDKSDPAVKPSSAYHTRINCIGGNNWNMPGEKITWEFEAPQDALYTIAFNYRQNYISNASSIRKMEIDGAVPFSQAYDIRFPYSSEWAITSFGDELPYKVFLSKGKHTISLEVSLGEVSEINRNLKKLIYDVGELYRQIVMITGSSPDANRDYRLFEQLPSLNDNLLSYKERIDKLVDEYNSISRKKGGTNAVTLEKLGLVLERMRKSKFAAHEFVGDLFNNYSSASAWVYEMRQMPLDIEKIIISGEKSNYSEYKSTSFERFVFGIKRLIASFVVDYNNFSKSTDRDTIDVWVDLGRDQAGVLTRMVEDSFSAKNGIKVNVKLSTASMIQANLSGNAPDCTVLQEVSSPVNLAMRGALYDLSTFDDFESVIKDRYDKISIITPYKYKDGVYGLPDSRTFPLMYIRNDVFDQLGLSVPETWDDFIRCSSVIMRNNLSVCLPQMYTTFLYQFGGKLYNDDLTATELNTPEAYRAFEYFCSLYTEYKFPVEMSFYNRFRTGETPMGIASINEFATLMAAASEINGVWNVYPVPGMKNGDKINKTVIGSGTASVILKKAKNPQKAWEFLKWWTNAESQYRYSSDVESVAGLAARHTSANVHALSQQSWGRNNAATVISQFYFAEDVPQVPGGYYLTRAINNAFFSVNNQKENPKKMLLKWSTKVDDEMARKIKEYS